MYLAISRSARIKKRGKTNRYRAKLKAQQRRRVNGMHGRPLGRRLRRNG
jgi:hypothetical protein